MKKIVIGGSGFIAQAIQQHVVSMNINESFVFTYNNHPRRIHEGLRKIKLNLLDRSTFPEYQNFPMAIYVAGNADHKVARKDPLQDLELNVRTFLNFMEYFRGSLILLSTQAVYYGLEGEVSENVNHIATIPYGLSKQMLEIYAKYFLNIGYLHKLWIFRLMYAFGKGEKEIRLIPTCARTAHTKEKINIFGGGRSFINPLPSQFVAKILLNAAEKLEIANDVFLEITNLNHPETITVEGVVSYLNSLKPFNYTIEDTGEEWPIRFWGNTNNLYSHMKEWNMDFPDIWESLRHYFLDLIK